MYNDGLGSGVIKRSTHEVKLGKFFTCLPHWKIVFVQIQDGWGEERCFNGRCWDTRLTGAVRHYWLIIVCCLLRRWSTRLPLKDAKVWCHHLQFSAITSARVWLWCNSSDYTHLLHSSSSLSVILYLYHHFFNIPPFRHYLSQKHFKQTALRLT